EALRGYAQVRVYKAKLFNSLSQRDHAWQGDVLEVSGRWEGDVSKGPLVPISYCDELGPDMAKVRRALNIPLRFREWRWLLSEYREEDGSLPLPRMSKGGSRTVLTLMICLADRKNVLLNLSQRAKLLPNLQEVKLLLRTQRMGLHRGRNQGFLLLRRLKWGLLPHPLPGSSISWVQIARRL
ncbi:Serine protease inhibitor SERPIN family protein, partial [Prunus dulcis]